MTLENNNRHRVLMVGGGFGGLQVVKHLRHVPVEVTLVDCRNFHLFQPLTYQVATGTLSPSDVTYPLRSVFGSYENVRVILADVSGFDLAARRVLLTSDERNAVTRGTRVRHAGGRGRLELLVLRARGVA